MTEDVLHEDRWAKDDRGSVVWRPVPAIPGVKQEFPIRILPTPAAHSCLISRARCYRNFICHPAPTTTIPAATLPETSQNTSTSTLGFARSYPVRDLPRNQQDLGHHLPCIPRNQHPCLQVRNIWLKAQGTYGTSKQRSAESGEQANGGFLEELERHNSRKRGQWGRAEVCG